MPLLEKSWSLPFAGRKKYASFELSYSLSKLFDRKRYEVVNESYVDLHDLDSEQPDVVIYDKTDKNKAVLFIELASHESVQNTINTIEIISRIYHVPEAFVLDFENNEWFKVKGDHIETTAISERFGVDLSRIYNQALV